MSIQNPSTLVLASGSRYRRDLLERLKIPFQTCESGIDESRTTHEQPRELVRRLAYTKAKSVANQYPEALIIGSDQVAFVGNEIFNKPLDFDTAFEQLRRASGVVMNFVTGLCVISTRTEHCLLESVKVGIKFRNLNDHMIERYLKTERPFDCAGSIKFEGLGIVLIEKFIGGDPTAIMGLPLIRLVSMLHEHGYDVLETNSLLQ